jgi:hypothetical protein
LTFAPAGGKDFFTEAYGSSWNPREVTTILDGRKQINDRFLTFAENGNVRR